MKLGSLARPFVIRREPARRVLQLAMPVILGSLSTTLLSTVDTIMLGRLGKEPLAASGIAGVFFFALVFSLGSISVGIQALTARRFGEGDYARCGEVLRTGLVLAAVIGIPLSAAAAWVASISAPVLSQDPVIAELGSTYLRLRLYGAAATLLSSAYGAFYSGIGATRFVLYNALLVTGANILLAYGLIFGRLGLPRLGIEGAGLAATLAVSCGLGYYVLVRNLPSIRRRFAGLPLRSLGVRWIGAMVRLSAPIVLQRIVSYGSWFGFFFVVSRIGTAELAATNVIRQIYSLPITIAGGVGVATATLVGQSLGAKQPGEAERAGWEGARIAAYAMGAIGLLFVFAPEFLLRIYTDEPSVIAAGRGPLLWLGLVQAFAGMALVLSQALQGAGNTRFVLGVELAVCGLIYLPIVFVLGLRTPLGLAGAWTGEYVYWIVLTTVMALKFRAGTWKTIRV